MPIGIATRAKPFHVQIRGATCILSQEIGSDITYRTPTASRPIPNLRQMLDKDIDLKELPFHPL